MKLRLLRNATLKLEIRGRIVLIDPFFAPKGSRPSFTGRAPNPLVELPASPEESSTASNSSSSRICMPTISIRWRNPWCQNIFR